MAVSVIHNPLSLSHETPEGHPECPERYSAVMDALKVDAEFWSGIKEIKSEAASKGVVQAAHTKEHFQRVAHAFENGLDRLDADTVISMQSLDAALFSAGGACRAVDEVMSGESDTAFVVTRPPGHHATAENAMGFCLFNNVAVAARYAQNRYKDIKNVAILDWDVHHGNGTQGIFFDDPSVFFFSMHQYPWYPGSGSRGEDGFGRGKGYTMNVPVKASTPAREQESQFNAAIGDISAKFKPDLIIISAGFDAHLSDPLGQLMLEDENFAGMTKTVLEWATEVCGGRVISCLEGGYNLKTLGNTVKEHVKALSAESAN
jgi:acetoin utilization deacetylase AcuC-like enzyme